MYEVEDWKKINEGCSQSSWDSKSFLARHNGDITPGPQTSYGAALRVLRLITQMPTSFMHELHTLPKGLGFYEVIVLGGRSLPLYIWGNINDIVPNIINYKKGLVGNILNV